MNVSLLPVLSDDHLNATQAMNQRQLAIFVSASADATSESVNRNASLNLCLILDCSGSMVGEPLQTIKQAAQSLVTQLKPGDRISVVVFDHSARVLIPNQLVKDTQNTEGIKARIIGLEPKGGTAIDRGIRLGLKALAKGKQDTVSQAFLLTDGNNQHGEHKRCLQIAELAARQQLTLNILGFGNQAHKNMLEEIASAGGGTLYFIEQLEKVVDAFSSLFDRAEPVELKNAYLLLTLNPGVRLADRNPIAGVVPNVVELTVQTQGNKTVVPISDLMPDIKQILIANLYIENLPEGKHTIANLQIRYDEPAQNRVGLLSESISIEATSTSSYQPHLNPEVQHYTLALAKYRQTNLAELRLQQGDRVGAVNLLRAAAETAHHMGDEETTQVLQSSATRLQSGEEFSESEIEKIRIVSKTIFQQ